MKRAVKWSWPVLVTGGMLWLVSGGFQAQEAPSKDVSGSLRDVINRGAKIFNENGDYAGCYRLFEGALVAVRPYLSADLQREIDAAFANAGRMPSYVDKAFELRRVLDVVRDGRPAATDKTPIKDRDKVGVKDKDKKPADKKPADKIELKDKDKKPADKVELKDKDKKPADKIELKDKDKKPADKVELKDKDKKIADKIDVKDKKPADKIELKDKDKKVADKGVKDKDKVDVEPLKTGDVKGKVTFAGKPVGKGDITFVAEGDKKGSSRPIQADGSYIVNNLLQGKYQIGVTGAGVPARFKDPATSGLTFRVSPGVQTFDITLIADDAPKDKKDADKKDATKKDAAKDAPLKDKAPTDKNAKDKSPAKDAPAKDRPAVKGVSAARPMAYVTLSYPTAVERIACSRGRPDAGRSRLALA